MLARESKLEKVLWNDKAKLEDLIKVAGGAALELGEDAWERISASRAVVNAALESGKPIYGLNTGLGSLRKYIIPDDALLEFNREVIVGHALSIFSDEVPPDRVRAMIAARVCGFMQGGSGVRPELVQACLDLLEKGVHPIVHAKAVSVGESDLAPMAEVGLVLIGLGHAEYGGQILSGGLALGLAGLKPIVLEAKEGLALISSNALSVGGGALALSEARGLLELADLAAALSFEGFAVNLGVLDEYALEARPFGGQRARGKNLRRLLEGSTLWTGEPRNLQDPLSFRCVPQVHGAIDDVLEDAEDTLSGMLNARVDSPLVTWGGYLVSNGNFESTGLTFAFDAVRLALQRLVTMAAQRVTKQLWADFSGLPTALALPSEARRGMFHNMVNRTMAALSAKAYTYASPASLSYTPQVTEGSDDYASMAPLSLDRLWDLLKVAHAALALELLIARRAVDMRGNPLGVRLERVVALLDIAANESLELNLPAEMVGQLQLERFIAALTPAKLCAAATLPED